MHTRTSLVAQWLRSYIAMQGTWVPSLVREDSTCSGATEPVPDVTAEAHRPRAQARNRRSHHHEKPAHLSRVAPISYASEDPTHSNSDPVQPK